MKQKTPNRVTVGPLIRDKVVITDDKEMCEVLNEQYCSVFTREDTTYLPEVEKNFHYSEDHELKDILFTTEKVRIKLGQSQCCPITRQALATSTTETVQHIVNPPGHHLFDLHVRGLCPNRLESGQCDR